jgi:predicted dehydrogenase
MNASLHRRDFVGHAVAGGLLAAGVLAVEPSGAAAQTAGVAESPAAVKKVRVGVIGCGSVSGRYLPNLQACPFVELVSVCDILPERAAKRAQEFKVPHHYAHIDAMLAGTPFELLVNLTDMQQHEQLNRRALEQGLNVWSEKPLANSWEAGTVLLELARSKGVQLWGAPAVVNSPQFAFMAQTVASGTLGRIAAAHADYGHTGPHWSSFFYEAGGGSMPDLGVYNLTSLTGVLGPARHVMAMTSVVTAEREIEAKGKIQVVAEDNTMILMDHGNGVISHVQCGFNYFNPHGHEGKSETRHTISVVGSTGSMGLVGYDWEPQGVDVATQDHPQYQRHVTDAQGYVWQQGASLAAESLATGKPLMIRPEHALHVLEIMEAARKSQETGQRIAMRSTFPWPIQA